MAVHTSNGIMGRRNKIIMTMRGGDMAGKRAEQARAWIVRLASGTMSADELDQLESWTATDPRNRAAFLHERQSWQDLDLLADAFGPPPHVLPIRRVRSQARRWVSTLVPVAAAVAIAWLAGPTAYVRLWADAISAPGEIRRVALADGSQALLDSDSAIAIDFDAKGRTLRLLKGRAWFSVRHGDARPFLVESAGGTVRDIGTAFEVDDTEANSRVGVTAGAVALEGGSPLILHAGQRAQFGPDGRAERLVALPVDRIGNWREGELLLRQVPLEKAIRAVARYRRAPVFILSDLADMKPVSASFRTDRPEEALDTLAAMRGLQLASLPGGVLFLRRAAD
ncbi:FecR family protein [Novosphingobium profundi]|uniref:FecR family protein n=1 Tax=Novosphingobium profundi TaxID=1774954 RepID=UPI001CFF03EE|nr:FecR domain-containing protein [Novosphingobium profundi]